MNADKIENIKKWFREFTRARLYKELFLEFWRLTFILILFAILYMIFIILSNQLIQFINFDVELFAWILGVIFFIIFLVRMCLFVFFYLIHVGLNRSLSESSEKESLDWRMFICIYLGLLLIILILSILISSALLYGDLFSGNADSARYLLSATTQAKAAIIALVVTLTLIAVQLTSQTYSQRIIGLFRSVIKNYPFWLLLFFYSVSIMYDVVILGTVKGNSDLFDHRISFAVLLTGFALIALVPYTRNVMDNLYPPNIIDRIIGELDLDSMKESVNLERELDRVVRSVVVIIKMAINYDDVTTSESGIEKLEELLEKLFYFALENQMGDEEYLAIVRYFCSQFEKIGDRATFREDGDSVIRVCQALEKIGKLTAENGLDDATTQVISSLGYVGIKVAEKRLNSAVTGATNSLCGLGVVFSQQDIKDLIESLNEMHKKSPGMVRENVNKYESDLEKEGDESKVEAFQEFRRQLYF
ncbi:MAG: hypothetical protein A7315_14520 [Candidatus Altiarchaeales archaeon WOR_SM1_79]|nr:MAG: hypothetical protein A7315_14520 [Candidatus Altiarchaeales archaeon WOR_SM1_79]